jgi:hypothetical protein
MNILDHPDSRCHHYVRILILSLVRYCCGVYRRGQYSFPQLHWQHYSHYPQFAYSYSLQTPLCDYQIH